MCDVQDIWSEHLKRRGGVCLTQLIQTAPHHAHTMTPIVVQNENYYETWFEEVTNGGFHPIGSHIGYIVCTVTWRCVESWARGNLGCHSRVSCVARRLNGLTYSGLHIWEKRGTRVNVGDSQIHDRRTVNVVCYLETRPKEISRLFALLVRLSGLFRLSLRGSLTVDDLLMQFIFSWSSPELGL